MTLSVGSAWNSTEHFDVGIYSADCYVRCSFRNFASTSGRQKQKHGQCLKPGHGVLNVEARFLYQCNRGIDFTFVLISAITDHWFAWHITTEQTE